MLVPLECLGVYQLKVKIDMRKIIQSERLHVCVGIAAGGDKGYGDIYGARENKFVMMLVYNELMVMLHVSAY